MLSSTNHKTLRIATLLTILFYCIQAGYSQGLLFAETNIDSTALDSCQYQRYSDITRSAVLANHQVIKYSPLNLVQVDGEVKVKLDIGCDTLLFFVESIEYSDSANFYWYGLLENDYDSTSCCCHLGELMILSDSSRIIGHLSMDSSKYEITHLGDSLCLLSTFVDNFYSEFECNVPDTLVSESTQEIDNDISIRNPGNCDVRCLVLYTSKALEKEGSIDNITLRAKLGVRQTNQVFKNSLIDDSSLRITLVGIEYYDEDEDENIIDDLTKLQLDPDVADLRSQYEADIVVLLAEEGAYGDTYGTSTFPVSSELDAFAIVTGGPTATGTYTFSHEIAHLFGAGHENYSVEGIPHGYDFRTGWFLPIIFGPRQLTVMHRLIATLRGTRIPYLSNPERYYDGQATGVKDKNDNAQQVIINACTVAQYEVTELPAFVSIGGDFLACPCTWVSLAANIIGGTAGVTYSFVWETSIDGINWTFSSTGTTHSIHTPCQENFKTIWVRVTAIGSNGSKLVDHHSIHAYRNRTDDDPCEVPQEYVVQPTSVVLAVYPNPAHESVNLRVNVAVPGKYSLALFNSLGEKVVTIEEKKYFEMGEYSYFINLKQQAQPGVQFISCFSEGELKEVASSIIISISE